MSDTQRERVLRDIERFEDGVNWGNCSPDTNAAWYRLRAALTEPQGCEWTYDDTEGSWNGTCGIKWWLDGTPTEHEMKYCPGCGGKLHTPRGG